VPHESGTIAKSARRRPEQRAPDKSSRATGTRLRPRLLIVEDRPETRDMYAQYFEHAGWFAYAYPGARRTLADGLARGGLSWPT
jgi:hypothetical protein